MQTLMLHEALKTDIEKFDIAFGSSFSRVVFMQWPLLDFDTIFAYKTRQ
jgi:hypothetical protein